MKAFQLHVIAAMLAATAAAAQSPPRIVPFTGAVVDATGAPRRGPVLLTFALYEEPTGGAALWLEMQTVDADDAGRYTVLLGRTTDGLPVHLFDEGTARWLGVQVPGEPEQPRVQLTAVPYALAAVDAHTLGGLPASAFVRNPRSKNDAPENHAEPVARGSVAGLWAATPLQTVSEDLTVRGQLTIDTQPVSGEPPTIPHALTVVGGMAGQQLVDIQNTVGGVDQNFGLRLQAGSSSRDYSLAVQSASGTPLLLLDGRGHLQLGGIGAAPVTGADAQLHIEDQSGSTPMLRVRSHAHAGPFANTYGTEILHASSFARLHGVRVHLGENYWLRRVLDVTSNAGPVASFVSTGQVGIGTQYPTDTLDVRGGLRLTGRIVFQGGVLTRALTDPSPAHNTAFGYGALSSPSPGERNTALGHAALLVATGTDNTAVGHNALVNATSGHSNTAVGADALGWSTSGSSNTAIGRQALYRNEAGDDNTAVGARALERVSSGHRNIAVGVAAGASLLNGDDNIYIGHPGVDVESNTIRIGDGQYRTVIAGIRGANLQSSDPVPVLIDGTGRLGMVVSSQRYKEDIHDMGGASRGILRLRPVSFRYKQPSVDGSKPIDYGLIAEEVALVYPDLVVYDKEGRPETVQYQKLTPLMLNELQRGMAELETLLKRVEELEVSAAERAQPSRRAQ